MSSKSNQRNVILCVDDEKSILDTLERQVSQRLGESFLVETAQSGDEALEILDELMEEGHQVAVVMSDMIMPGMKGDELLIQIHQRLPDVPKILLTGQADFDAVVNAINRARLYRYIAKPWEPNDLLMTVEQAANSFLQTRKIDESNKYIQLLGSLNAAIQTLSQKIQPEDVQRSFIQLCHKHTGAKQAYILLTESSTNSAVNSIEELFACLSLEGEKMLSQPMKMAEIFAKTQRLITQNGFDSEHPTAMALPIHKAETHFGFIYLEGDAFSEGKLAILRMLTAQAAISLDNANLYHDLHQKNKDITDSIQYARRIQFSILPDRETVNAIIPDSFVLYRPKDIVSGDFYWWAERNGKLLLATVDCTGHGVPGAFMSVIGSNLLNLVVKDFGITETDVILYQINLHIRRMLNRNGEANNAQTKDGMDVALVSIDVKTGILEYAGARRPLYINRKGQLMILQGNKFSIGDALESGESPSFHAERISIESGDAIYLFSDGLVDQFGGPKNRKFTPRRLQQLITDFSGLPMAEQEQRFNQIFTEWQGSLPQTDDVLLLGFRL